MLPVGLTHRERPPTGGLFYESDPHVPTSTIRLGARGCAVTSLVWRACRCCIGCARCLTQATSRHAPTRQRGGSAGGIPDCVAHGLVRTESGYRPRMVGRAGEIGLTQIKLATARGVGFRGSRSLLFDPRTNLTFGFRYAHQALTARINRTLSKRHRRSTLARLTWFGSCAPAADCLPAAMRRPRTASQMRIGRDSHHGTFDPRLCASPRRQPCRGDARDQGRTRSGRGGRHD